MMRTTKTMYYGIKRILTGLSLIILASCSAMAAITDEERAALKDSKNSVSAEHLVPLNAEQMKGWSDAKFGMFIHWGVYAIPAKGEWVQHNDKIPNEEYAKLADQFNPTNYNPAEWARIAKSAGMKYTVLTARHHDGFALWDSPSSWKNFTSMKTAAKRDLVSEYVKAIREAGLYVGLYYSPLDWRMPGYFDPKGLPESAAELKKQGWAQVKELMSNYGKIDILWYDGAWLALKGTDADAAWFWEPVKLNTMARKLQPGIIINPRSGWEGDFECAEGGSEVRGAIRPTPWEKCCNLNKCGWGFCTQQNLMSRNDVIRMLDDVVVRGGNLLLNVGPDRDGVIPPGHAAVLKNVGDWLTTHGEAIYGTRPGPLQPLDDAYGSTYRGKTVYLHIVKWPDNRTLTLRGVNGKILTTQTLTGGKVEVRQEPGKLIVIAGADVKVDPVTIIKLDYDTPITGVLPPLGTKLSGTVIGTPGSYENKGATIEKGFDGDLKTGFSSPNPGSDGWLGLDLGANKAASVSAIRFISLYGHITMAGCRFQGADEPTFSAPVDLYVVPATGHAGGHWNEVTLWGTKKFRYLRYLSVGKANVAMAEVEFYGE
jgi:alpha-L-fucosidase